ncbi:uncharacterized protein LOC9653312 isoform X1 [Selaginella moellendorffii]|uniref:uncharacterized protein LOC9653312 isoform X1 n=1 Tax=Selaginella moellendorffii TaxID=88036 RepID=UPI000D1C889D|nr:uncharacterized protein LOC9653312 isoform X1 [Selaginella moellendorffii]|eukprot:XP_024539014.1 uncharacterized protein LOC9653312 isoform X1 [Selaginella moellendorffii]
MGGRKTSGNSDVDDVLQLLQREAPLSKEQAEYCNEACVARYLRARSGSVKKAAKQLRASLSWRESLEIGYLTADDFPAELAAGIAFVSGQDDDGKPVLVLRTKQEFLPPRSQKREFFFWRFIRFLVFSFEVAVSSMPPGVDQFVMLIDFSGSSRGSSSLLSFILSIMKLLSDHYPERLAPSFFVDAPSMFYYLWKGMAPFIDHATKEKWSFSFSRDHDMQISGPSCEPAERAQPPPSSLLADSSCSCSSTPSSFRATLCYEERLNAMSFLTPLSSPGGQSFFKNNSLGAALASDAQHRSLSFSSPAATATIATAASFNFRTPDSSCSDGGGVGGYGSPVFARSSRSRGRSSSREMGSVASSSALSYLVKHKRSSSSSSSVVESFRPYVRHAKAGYSESAYRATLKPPLGGLLCVIKSALNLGQTDDYPATPS